MSRTRRPPLVVRVSVLLSTALLGATAALASFVAGYALAFSRVADVYAQTNVLEAKAQELEAEMLHLRNYAVLIDAIAARGEAANQLQSASTLLYRPNRQGASSDSGANDAPSSDGASPE